MKKEDVGVGRGGEEDDRVKEHMLLSVFCSISDSLFQPTASSLAAAHNKETSNNQRPKKNEMKAKPIEF